MPVWETDSYFEELYRENEAERREAASRETPAERRERLKRTLRELVGEFAPAAGDFSPSVMSREDCGEYIRERVVLSGVRGMTFAAYVLSPKERRDGKLPGVLAVHGHGYGSREIVGLLPDGSPDAGEPGIHRHYAVELAKRGMVAIAPDVLGFGERRLAEDLAQGERGPSSCYKMATQLLLYGKTLTGLRVQELLAALEYLMRREDVDSERIGAMGFSGGALLSLVCAALDERIRATVLTGFPGTFKGTIMAVHHCIDNFTPGMLKHAELPEWIALLAPRALFVESGMQDPIFPLASSKSAIAELTARYEREGAAAYFASDLFPGVHEVSGRRSYDWLAQRLSQ